MEICGTHTRTAAEGGLHALLPENITLVSGPGCPVCVTGEGVIDKLADLSETACVASFGDMLKVRGSRRSLSDAKADGGDVRFVYSPFDALKFAQAEPKKLFITAAVGFETTAPIYCAMIEKILTENIDNVKFCFALKTMPAAVEYICEGGEGGEGGEIGGFIAPGHVCAITGTRPFAALSEKYRKPFVAAGFTPKAMLAAINEIARQISAGEYGMKNFYKSAVTEDGQPVALELLAKYFEPYDAYWRGIGEIKGSGLKLREKYSYLSIEANERGERESGCQCGEVMLGKIAPKDCPLFGTLCTPQTPQGACMVTTEGACAITHQFSPNKRRGF